MTYNETLDFLFAQLPMYQRVGQAAYKADLKTTIDLDNYFKHPHKSYRTIHVAGTNGKGSVSHCLATVLQQAGYNVGLYTSPHLRDFRERIRINGQMITENAVVRFVEEHQSIIKELQPSFFEMSVAMAFDYFREQAIDIAVVEVGMGGRLDSTNIIQPDLTTITNIGKDHTAFLGNNLGDIAREKAGIIKANTPLVVGQTQIETESVFKEVASEKNAPIIFADQELEVKLATLSLNDRQIFQVYDQTSCLYPDLKLDLLGIYQQKNIVTALTAIKQLQALDYRISKDDIYKGLNNVVKQTGLIGRWQILGNNPKIVCDTGHNLDGMKHIVAQLTQTAFKKLHMVIGMVNDKDHQAVLEILPKDAIYYFTRASIPRSLDQNKLKEVAFSAGLHGESYPNVMDALENAKKNADSNDLIFIGGSTFVVADTLEKCN